MRTFFPGLSIALLATSVSAYAEPETGSRLDKAPGSLVYSEETPVVAQFVNRFSRCVARDRRLWSDQVLSLPYAGEQQSAFIKKGIGGLDVCLGETHYSLELSPGTILGGLAEQRVVELSAGHDFRSLAAITDKQLNASPIAPRNLTEDFAMCFAREAPRELRAVIDTQPGTPEEAALIKPLVPLVGPCVSQGLNVKFTYRAMRALGAFGLYRLLQAGAPVPVAEAAK